MQKGPVDHTQLSFYLVGFELTRPYSARWHSTLMFEMCINCPVTMPLYIFLLWTISAFFTGRGEISPPLTSFNLSVCVCPYALTVQSVVLLAVGIRAPEYRGCEGSRMLEIRNVKRSSEMPNERGAEEKKDADCL